LSKFKNQGENHSVFVYCPKLDKVCGFCAESTYNSLMDRHEDKEHLLCGLATGFENRVDKLPDCWKTMTNSQKSAFRKQTQKQYEALKLVRR
jgi:hypothetical protein